MFLEYYFITRCRGKKNYFLCSSKTGREVWRKRGPKSVGSAIMYDRMMMRKRLKSLRAHGRNKYKYDYVFVGYCNQDFIC